MIKYFNIEYSDGGFHLFINGILSKSMSSDLVKSELDTWLEEIDNE